MEGKQQSAQEDCITAQQSTEMVAPVYEWQEGATLVEKCQKLEKRRTELKDIMAGLDRNEDLKPLLDEWAKLTEMRADICDQLLVEENLRLKTSTISELFYLLNDIILSEVEFDSNEQQIAAGIKSLHRSLTQSFAATGFIPMAVPQEKAQTSVGTDTAGLAPAPPPLPPPPPPMAPALLRNGDNPKKKAKRKSISSPLIKSSSSPRTPLRPRQNTPAKGTPLNSDLLYDISRNPRASLRKTAVERSPGGTPCRTKRRYSTLDGHDLIAIALKNKFKNAYSSPINDNTSSPTAYHRSFGLSTSFDSIDADGSDIFVETAISNCDTSFTKSSV